MNVNHVAFATTTALAAATIGTAFAAAATAGAVATVAYTILAITFAGASLAGISAWVETSSSEENSKDIGKYFSTMKSHAGVAIAGFYQFTAQVLVQSVIRGLADGISKTITRKIAGPDVTYRQERTA